MTYPSDRLLIAMMPTVFVGGPLALIAFLFPTVCVGLTLFLRRWRMVLSVLSLDSFLYLLHQWSYVYQFDSWRFSRLELWFVLTMVAVMALVLRCSSSGANLDVSTKTNSVTDIIALGTVLILSGVGCLCVLAFPLSWMCDYFGPLLIIGVGAGAGLCHAILLRMFQSKGMTITNILSNLMHPSVPVSGLNCPSAEGIGETSTMTGENVLRRLKAIAWFQHTPEFVLLTFAVCGGLCVAAIGIRMTQADSWKLKWTFSAGRSGALYSSPLVAGNKIYMAAALYDPSGGEVYCLERATGQLVWSFNDDGKIKSGISSPVSAEGKIYFGEGFHEDAGCHLYCVSADAGKLLWRFQTASHTESTPNIVDGRVYFGAGDDGLYCLDANTGEERWHFRGVHADGRPAIANDRVYAGSGYGTYEVFCVDAHTGEPHWRLPIDGPSFGSPKLDHGLVFFGVGSLGNREHLRGALLCLEQVDGKQKWRYEVPHPVHSAPIVTADQVIFVASDECYCVEVASGNLRWKQPIGLCNTEPILTSNRSGVSGAAVWIVSQDGSLTCLDAATGVGRESIRMQELGPIHATPFSRPVIHGNRSLVSDGYTIYAGCILRTPFPEPAVLCLELP